jgi:hypothetical protein
VLPIFFKPVEISGIPDDTDETVLVILASPAKANEHDPKLFVEKLRTVIAAIVRNNFIFEGEEYRFIIILRSICFHPKEKDKLLRNPLLLSVKLIKK